MLNVKLLWNRVSALCTQALMLNARELDWLWCIHCSQSCESLLPYIHSVAYVVTEHDLCVCYDADSYSVLLNLQFIHWRFKKPVAASQREHCVPPLMLCKDIIAFCCDEFAHFVSKTQCPNDEAGSTRPFLCGRGNRNVCELRQAWQLKTSDTSYKPIT